MPTVPDTYASKRSSVLVVVACVLVQLLLGGHVSLLGAVPNFLLCAVFFLALRKGAFAGVIAGFALGLLFDMLGSSTLGLSSLLGSIFAFACAHLGKPTLLREPLRACVVFFAADVVYNLISAAVMVLLGTMGATMGEVVGLALLASLLDSLFALLVFALYAGLSGGRRSRRLR